MDGGDARLGAGRARLGACVTATAMLVLGGLMLLRIPPGAPPPVAASAALNTPRDDEPLEHAADGLPIKPRAAGAKLPDGPMHPHPITPAHERIFRENALVGALNLAVDLADPVQLRELVAQYRAEFPEDDNRLQDGYALIADCLEHLDAATRERAQHFWQAAIRSQTRRYVRRHCLER